ncbi:MAG TPA: hypothetical protein VLS28_02525 [Candidatus Sulfomarinibacteraceae bacterium]|nr:hypothetical protein [Candidatus Sulfomarinibacteraceae bacterium]
MNQRSDIDRLLRHWMDDGPTRMPDRIVDVVADRISRERQRRSWRRLRRLPMSPLSKLGAAAAAVLIVAVVAWQVLPHNGGVGGQPTATPPPTAASASTPDATGPMALPAGTLAGGRYRIRNVVSDGPSLSAVADIPEGWFGYPQYSAITSGPTDDDALITFVNADGLFSDPCQWDLDGTGARDQPGDVVVGPTVDDLVEALRANTSYTASTPSPITLGGFQGTELELQLPGDDVLSTCDREPGGDPKGLFFVFSGEGAGWYSQGPDSRWRLFIVDVDGTRLIALISYFPGTPQADVAAAQAIVESLEFTP